MSHIYTLYITYYRVYQSMKASPSSSPSVFFAEPGQLHIDPPKIMV